MIKLIIGNKGSGKTKTLIEMVNNSASQSKGNVVCLEKGLKLTYDLKSAVRLIDTDEYKINSFDGFYGFVAGLLAGNYDITEVYIDSIFKIGGRDLAAFEKLANKLAEVFKDIDFVFTLSASESEIPESLKKHVI